MGVLVKVEIVTLYFQGMYLSSSRRWLTKGIEAIVLILKRKVSAPNLD